jgi:hypothetical protein
MIMNVNENNMNVNSNINFITNAADIDGGILLIFFPIHLPRGIKQN